MKEKAESDWNKLIELSKDASLKDLQSLFSSDVKRAHNHSFEIADIFIDFSKNWINSSVLESLLKLAHASGLQNKISAMFSGDNVNISEGKPATHTAQRQTQPSQQMQEDRDKMFTVAGHYRSGKWKTAFNKKVKAVVNIGIGGSYLGPKLAIQALTELQTNCDIKILFYPSVDDSSLKRILQFIDVTETLFCISSKSLGTIETIRNTQTITLLLEKIPNYQPQAQNQSFVVATANLEKAQELNFPQSHIMPFDAATGGRFSVWSSIGFPLLMGIGKTKFEEFLSGAEIIDNHFETTDFEKNIPVLMAMISIWYRNFMNLSSYAIIPYDARLKNLPAWLQQLMMESNGKNLNTNGEYIEVSTSPLLFGGHGQLSQHAFFQAFHQGHDILPIDFIGVLDKKSEAQNFLLINMLAQSAALMTGNHEGEKMSYCEGNRPSTTILLKELTASSLGQLLALYEHMIYVQSVIWDINCFDQPGVELGKRMARKIGDYMQEGKLHKINLDQSTQQILKRVLDND